MKEDLFSKIVTIEYNEDGTPKQLSGESINTEGKVEEYSWVIKFSYEEKKVIITAEENPKNPSWINNYYPVEILLDDKGRRADYIEKYFNGLENEYDAYHVNNT